MKDKVAVGVGLVAIVGMLAFIAILIPKAADAQQEEWARLVYLLGGVEAIAFAAAGYFFGREVNRARAERAEQDATASRDDARNAEARADLAERHGQSLADLIRSSTGAVLRVQDEVGMQEATEGVASGLFGDLRAMADRYFPRD